MIRRKKGKKMSVMKQSSPSIGPPSSKEESEESTPRTRFGKLKKALRGVKKKMTGQNKKTRVRSTGILKGQWRQEDLPKIVKRISDRNPGLTSIEIYSNEIRWYCENNYFDLFPRKKGNQNPSKRDEERI